MEEHETPFDTAMSHKKEFPHRVEEWTKEQVRQWLTEELKVDQTWADSLYEEDVSGKELICYKAKDLQELHIKHGPAVRIINTLEALVQSQKNEPVLDIQKDTPQTQSEPSGSSTTQCTESRHDISVDTAVPTSEQPQQKRKKKKQKSHKKALGNSKTSTNSENIGSTNEEPSTNTTTQTTESQAPKPLSNVDEGQPKEMPTVMPSQTHKKRKNKTDVSSRNMPPDITETEPAESTDVPKMQVSNAEEPEIKSESKQLKPKHLCTFYPFDQQSAPHRYIENYILPPESGPSNLIDPVHEYKFLGRAEDIHIMKKKINKEVFRFAAGCMNARTNGTIHFGVADSKNSEFSHGEIVGVSVDKTDTIIDHFNQGIKQYFEDSADDAKRCIRQPRFVEVLCCDSTSSSKYVIEVDVVPSYIVVHEKIFYTQTLDEENQWKKCKGKSLFIREGAATRDMQNIPPKELTKVIADLKILDTKRKEAEINPNRKRKLNQGEKFKSLLTDSDYYIIVTNKSHPEQLEHLKFLTTLRLFCVLDFDPDSVVNGTCHIYRKNRVANIHTPKQFHGDPGILTQNLNLYKQTSWVMCNGRLDINTESDKPLPPNKWLINRAGEVQDMISFLCNPDTLPRRSLVIFLLLSVVEDMNDPIFDTFMSFYKNLGGIQNIISICTTDNAFQKWKDFIQIRTEEDLSRQRIFELELSEINGSILEKHNQTTERLLPSFGGSSVVVKQIDEDSMPALDILYQNQCENLYVEDSEEFKDFRKITEAEFYRGDKVKWWNFYFSDKTPTKPFIKRHKYKQVLKMVSDQTRAPTSTCFMVNLFHHPGCGGTTLAMHVMWDLRKEFRCAVLKDNTITKTEVAQQVAYLIKCGKSEQSHKTPVLLLVDDSEDTENTQELQHCLRKIIGEMDAFVVLLNCIRSKNPKEKWRNSVIESQYITASLSKEEQNAFEVKLQELHTIHDKPENFYSFMIMKTNFNQEYVTNVASNILRDVDVGSREAQLLSILALLNMYVAESNISVSLCEDFLGIKRRLWGTESVLDKMEPYSCLLIEFQAEECGVYKAIRFVHQRIAEECVMVLEERHRSPRADIILNMLHTNLFFERGMGRDSLLQSVKSMLITRQRKTEGDEKDTLFSPLIEDIKSGSEGPKKIENILTEASKRFDKDFTIPQALARHYYLNDKNFALAKDWANNAKTIKLNSYTADTVGQVSRTELKYKIDGKKQEKSTYTAEDFKEFLELAKAAINAFRTAQTLAKEDDVADTEEKRHWKQNIYNISGYMNEIDIAMTVFDIVKGLPLFEENDPMKHDYIKQFFKGKMTLSSIRTAQTELSDKLIAVLKDNETFLISLKSHVDRAFEFLEEFFTYTREKGVDKEKLNKNRKWISDHFKTYISLFCSSSEEKQRQRVCKPKLSLHMEIEECKMFLEENRANNFPRLLRFLEVQERMIEQIAEKYSFIYQNYSAKSLQDKTNHLLTHIILKLNHPTSKLAKPQKGLTDLLMEILQEAGLTHQYPEPYYLALLLLWPGKKHVDKRITTYVENIKRSSRKQHSHLFRARTPIAHLYLGKADGLDRLVSKTFLDRSFSHVSERNILWQNAEIFKEAAIKEKLLRVNGIITQGELYAEYGKLQIPVHPTYLGGIRSGHSTEKVSFYVGFAIDGPRAYDIQYEES